ncbi:MAG: TMEM165/GDT1 family protein [Elstera sp.]
MFTTFFISTGAVALSELGDKTQLFALLLALRYRAPGRLIAGIFLATVLNHVAAGWLAVELADQLPLYWLRMGTGIACIALAAWMLLPDKLEEDEDKPSRFGPFAAALVGFFLLEIGDKTQVATMLMATAYQPFVAVMIGSIFGMMLVNAPIVMIGRNISARLPLKATRTLSAVIFAIMGVVMLPLWG